MTQVSRDSNPWTAKLFERLAELGIETSSVEHPPVFTVEEAKTHRGALEGTHIKNLFLRNKKKRMWLVVVPEDKSVDLHALGEVLGAGKLSFGSADRLRRVLKVEPGAVTPLAALCDTEGEVQVVLDAELPTDATIHCHPLVNTMTTALRTKDLLAFLRAVDHQPRVLPIPAR